MKTLLFPVLISLVGMHRACAQPLIKVSGSDDSLTHLTQIHQCLDYLEVHETVYLHVTFSSTMPEHLEGITLAQGDASSDEPLFIRVRINAGLNKPTQRLVLAHEMIHVKQYVKGELTVIDRQQAVWKGKTYNYSWFDHRATPWERDAFRMHNRVAKVAKEPSPVPLTASRTDARQP